MQDEKMRDVFGVCQDRVKNRFLYTFDTFGVPRCVTMCVTVNIIYTFYEDVSI